MIYFEKDELNVTNQNQEADQFGELMHKKTVFTDGETNNTLVNIMDFIPIQVETEPKNIKKGKSFRNIDEAVNGTADEFQNSELGS